MRGRLRDFFSTLLGPTIGRLYTVGDLATFALRRTVALSAIALPTLQDDLADRLLALQLVPIGTPNGGWNALGWKKPRSAKAHHVMPRALGGLCDLVAAC